MKTNLQLLIEQLQTEYDYLKSSMDACVAEWDFDGAKAFHVPVIFTKRKLDVLKSLDNPNFIKINRLVEVISRLEKSVSERLDGIEFLDEHSVQRLEQQINDLTINTIEKSKQELEKLKSIIPTSWNDDDKILELLENLERNLISQVEFEIKKDKIYLLLSVKNDKAEMEFKTPGRVSIDYHLTKSDKSIIKNLGFNTETYKKQISNFGKLDKLKVLEDLAIIYFEVFGIFGEGRDVRSR